MQHEQALEEPKTVQRAGRGAVGSENVGLSGSPGGAAWRSAARPSPGPASCPASFRTWAGFWSDTGRLLTEAGFLSDQGLLLVRPGPRQGPACGRRSPGFTRYAPDLDVRPSGQGRDPGRPVVGDLPATTTAIDTGVRSRRQTGFHPIRNQ